MTTKAHTFFSIIVIGAGSVGLATAIALSQSGHEVLVLERHKQDDESSGRGRGSGITLYPGAVKHFSRWKADDFFKTASINGENQMRRYATGELLKALRQPKGGHQSRYILRADLVDILYEAAVKQGVEVKFGVTVMSIDATVPQLTLQDGQTLRCDILIGADGVRSVTRRAIFSNSDSLAHLTGGVTFQIQVPKEKMYAHPSTKALYDSPALYVGLGPKKMLIASAIRTKEHYDAQMACFDFEEDDTGPWGETCEDKSLIRSLVENWDDATKKIFAAADSAWKWRVGEVTRLPRWSTTDGKIILVGDACHAMVPYAGAGTGQGLEDAAVLAELLAHASSPSDLAQLSKLYYELRSKRVEKVQELANNNGRGLSLPDGPEQEERDRYFRIGLRRRHEIDPDYVDPLGDASVHVWLDTFDVVKEAQDEVRKLHLGTLQQARL